MIPVELVIAIIIKLLDAVYHLELDLADLLLIILYKSDHSKNSFFFKNFQT